MASDLDYDAAINEVFSSKGGIANDASDSDKYDRAISEVFAPPSKAAIDLGVRSNPDTEARNRQLSKQTGMPVDLVPHVVDDLDAKVRADGIAGKVENAPVSKLFFSDVGMVKLAHDDVDNLTAFETIANGFMGGRLTSQFGQTATRIRAEGQGITPQAKTELDAIRAQQKASAYSPDGWRSAVGSAAEFMGQRYESLADPRTAVMTAEGAAIGAATGLAGGVFAPVTVPVGATAGLASGFLAHSALTSYEQEGASSYISMVEAGVDENVAQAVSRGVGVANAVLETAAEKIGLSIAAKGLKAAINKGVVDGITRATVKLAAKEAGKAYGVGIAVETGTEIVQEWVQMLGENIARVMSPDDIKLITAEEAYSRTAEVAEKTFKGMLILAAPGPGMQFIAEGSAARRSEKQHESIIKMHDAAVASKLQARDPETAAQFREAVLNANGVSEAIVDGEAFAKFYQSSVIDDPDLAAKLDLTEAGLREALELGAEVRLNTKGYAYIQGLEAAKGLTDHIRLHADDMSAAQAKEYRANGMAEQISKAAARLDVAPEQAQMDAEVIQREVSEMLTGQFDARDVGFAALLLADRYVQRSARSGGAKSAIDFWREDNIQILGEGQQARPKIDDIGRAILKAKTITQEQAEKGLGISKTPIMDFLIARGGIDPNSIEAGEVRNILGGKKARPGLFKNGGMGRSADTTGDLLGMAPNANGMDNIVQAEDPLFADMQPTDDGYVDPGTIYDMLREEVAGRPYRTAEQQTRLEEMDADVKAIEAMLDEYNAITGEDVSLGSTDAEIRAAVEAMQNRPDDSLEGQTGQRGQGVLELFQAAYHGSPHIFDKFSLDHIGTGEGAQAYGWGLYFAGAKEVAEYYRDALTGRDARIDSEVVKYRGLSPQAWYDRAQRDMERSYRPGYKGDGFQPQAKAKFWEDVLLNRHPEMIIRDAVREAEDWPELAEYAKSVRLNDFKGLPDVAKGRLYKVEIPEDGEYLLWDKPLSEQPKAVKEALKLDQIPSAPPTPEETKAVFKLAKERGVPANTLPEYTALESRMDAARYSGYDVLGIAPVAAGWDETTGQHNELRPHEITGQQLYNGLTQASGSDKDASKALHALGIPGIKYLDGSSRAAGDGNFNYVLFDDQAVKIAEYEQKARGSILFGKEGIIIRLGADKDFSTFLHESGHLFLEQLRQDAERFPALKKDWKTVVEWWAGNTPDLKSEAIKIAASRNDEEAVTALGMMSDTEVRAYIRTGAPGAGRLGASSSAQGYIGIAMHEQWARGVEDYFRTGRAPSIALQDAFNAFKAWIKRIYAGAKKAQLDVRFSPEVKVVMDRMIASDEDIAEVEFANNMEAMFSDAEAIGMSKAQFQAYTESVRRAADESRAKQLAKHLREVNRVKTEWWQQEEAKVQAEVSADVMVRQEYIALYAITKGTTPDGAILDLPPGQMDRAEVVRILGSEAALKGLPKNGSRALYKKGGVDPSVVAQMTGYPSAMELLEALGAMRPMAEVIAEETAAKMKEIHGDMLTDKGLAAEQAVKSTYHDLRGAVLIAELNALRKSTDMLKPAFIRQWARDKIGKEIIAKIQPRIFQSAERKHGKAAAKAFNAANPLEAARSKFRQLMNFYMAKEAVAAKSEVDKGRDYLAKFLSPKKKWAGVDAEYIDKIRIILQVYDLGPRLSNRQRTIEELKALSDFVQREQQDEGAILEIPERILRADSLTNYQNLTLDGFRELVDTVKMIETQGRKKKSLIIKGEEVDRAEKQKEILDGMEALPELGRVLRETAGERKFWKFDKLRHYAASVDAALTKLSTLAEVIDGEVRGPFWRYVVEPFSHAAAQESDIKRQIVAPIIALFKAMPSEMRKAMNDSVKVPSMGRSFLRSELIMIALNVGSQSNYDKMKEGSAKNDLAGARPFTDQGILDAVNLLTDQELDIVEQIWKSFEDTYPKVEEIYRRENGVAPARVEARQFTTASGRVLTGGYFPMMYDSDASSGGKMIEGKNALEAMQSVEVKASVFSGMTKGRTGFSAPVLLDIGRLPSQFSKVAHFISHYEAVRSSRLLMNGPVRVAIKNKIGKEYADLIDNILGYVANNGAAHNDGMDRLAAAIKSNSTAAILAYSSSTIFMQFLGLTTAIAGVGKNPDGSQSLSKASLQIAAAMGRYLTSPKATRQFVIERSTMMRDRIDSAETMLSDIAADLEGSSSKTAKMRATGFKMIAGAQFYAVDLPTWMAAYDKALKTMDEKEAALHADYIVETTQTGGGLKDKSVFQTKGGLWNMLQYFYAPMNVLYNMLVGGAPTVRPVTKDVVGRWIARYFVTIVVMTAMETAMKGYDDEDDDGEEGVDDYLKTVMVKSILFPFALIPGVREIASGAAGDFGYSISPMASVGEAFVKSTRSISSDIDSGEFSKASLKAMASTMGGVFGLPSVQFNRMVDLIDAIYEGKDVGLRDILFGYKDKE